MAEFKRTYYPNGELATEVFEIYNIKEGIFKSYHINISNISELFNNTNTNSNQICIICYYVDNKINGEYKSYYKSGDLSSICYYIDDKIQGEYKKFYQNGQLEKIGNYVDGKEEGEFITYYETGQIKDICNYVNGEKKLTNFLFK